VLTRTPLKSIELWDLGPKRYNPVEA